MLNPYPDQTAIYVKLDSMLAQTVYEDVPDATLMTYTAEGVLIPYVTVDFSMSTALGF